jgi:hypothetical protein
MAVKEAQLPESGPDRGTSQNAWTTDQIGGKVVYRGGGPVANGLRSVGEPATNGVVVHVSAKPGSKCRGEIEGNDRLQALWVFSSDACGVDDFRDPTIVQAGRSNPAGEITWASEKGDLNVRAGSGMLLPGEPDARARTMMVCDAASKGRACRAFIHRETFVSQRASGIAYREE